MPFDADKLRSLARSQGQALLTQLEQLDDEQWSAPTVCAGWDVLDVLVHLQLGTDLHCIMVENGLAGRDQPPWDLPPGIDLTAAFKRIHRSHHAKGPGDNLVALRLAQARYHEALATLDDQALDTPAWFWGESVPLGAIVSARIFDLILHASDVRRAVRLTPWFSPAGARFAGQFATGLLERFFVTELAQGAEGAILQTIDGVPSQASLTLHGLRVGPPVGASGASLRADGGTWALLTWRRLSAAEARASGALTVKGDWALVKRYLGAFKTP